MVPPPPAATEEAAALAAAPPASSRTMLRKEEVAEARVAAAFDTAAAAGEGAAAVAREEATGAVSGEAGPEPGPGAGASPEVRLAGVVAAATAAPASTDAVLLCCLWAATGPGPGVATPLLPVGATDAGAGAVVGGTYAPDPCRCAVPVCTSRPDGALPPSEGRLLLPRGCLGCWATAPGAASPATPASPLPSALLRRLSPGAPPEPADMALCEPWRLREVWTYPATMAGEGGPAKRLPKGMGPSARTMKPPAAAPPVLGGGAGEVLGAVPLRALLVAEVPGMG